MLSTLHVLQVSGRADVPRHPEVDCRNRRGQDGPFPQRATCVSEPGTGVAHAIARAEGKLPEEHVGSSFG